MGIVFLRILAVMWASPYSLLGLLIGLLGLCSGGRARVRSSVIEFHGGAVSGFVARLPGGVDAIAITFGVAAAAPCG